MTDEGPTGMTVLWKIFFQSKSDPGIFMDKNNVVVNEGIGDQSGHRPKGLKTHKAGKIKR